jgi:hypothetical protein
MKAPSDIMKKKKPDLFMRKEQLAMSVSQIMEALQSILEEQACVLARETGFIQRERSFTGADFAQTLIFGWLQEPQARLSGLAQMFERREVSISASGLSQRFTEEAATFMHHLLMRLVEVQIEAAPAEIALLRKFSGVIIEDSSTITLPSELAEVWAGWGGSGSSAALKLFVQWNLLSGQVQGPLLTAARRNDRRSPFAPEALPAGSLYLADLGFFGLRRLERLTQSSQEEARFFLSRLFPTTGVYDACGEAINWREILPQSRDQVKELAVFLGAEVRLPVRLIMIKVSEEVVRQRREHILDVARKHSRQPNEEVLFLAGWTLLVTNVGAEQLSGAEVLVLLRLRWQIERLFRLWKEHGLIDEWRSKKPWRILCEIYAKLCAMLIQHWLLQEGCWADPYRSLVKAAQVVRREANRIMLALACGGLEATLQSIVRSLGSGCRLSRRVKHPCAAQLATEGLDWSLSLT